MRIRSIKPEFWEDEDVAGLPPLTRLTFIGLWNLADDAGYMRWTVVGVAAALFRYDSKGKRERAVTDAVQRLEDTGMVEILDCGRHALVPNLPKHQRLAGETRRVHTLMREHLDECAAEHDSASSPTIPAHPRTSPRNARTSPPSRAPGVKVREVSPNGDGEGGTEGAAARVKPRGPTTNGSRSIDDQAITTSIDLAKDETKPASVRRAARRAVERHAPERLGELGVTA